jgi:hypothetical protein
MNTALTVVLGVGLFAASASAQQAVEIRREKVVAGHAIMDDVVFISSEFGFDGAVVKGAPYSADAVTETAQRLGDGNTIRRKSQAQVYRDGEGRTRRDETIEAIGPWAASAPRKTVMINDPAGGAHYVLDPASRTANRMPAMGRGQFNIHLPDGAPLPGLPPLGAGVHAYTYVQNAPGDAHGTAHGHKEATAAADGKGAPQVRTESLGKRMIEGVEAEGTRTTTTIAAGQIGNDLPIEMVSERWYSPELKTVVMTRRSDPRMGETTYRLTSIRRGEPGRTLFEVPADYTVSDHKPGVQIRKRIEERK